MYYHWPDNLSFCNTQEQPRHISSAAACSSAGASASATSSETGAWQCRYAIKCQVELVAIPSTHTTLKAFISASLGEHSHVFTKQNQELTELRQDMINFILKIMQASSKSRRWKKRNWYFWNTRGCLLRSYFCLFCRMCFSFPRMRVVVTDRIVVCVCVCVFFCDGKRRGCPLQTFFLQSAIFAKNGGELHWRPFVNFSPIIIPLSCIF